MRIIYQQMRNVVGKWENFWYIIFMYLIFSELGFLLSLLYSFSSNFIKVNVHIGPYCLCPLKVRYPFSHSTKLVKSPSPIFLLSHPTAFKEVRETLTYKWLVTLSNLWTFLIWTFYEFHFIVFVQLIFWRVGTCNFCYELILPSIQSRVNHTWPFATIETISFNGETVAMQVTCLPPIWTSECYDLGHHLERKPSILRGDEKCGFQTQIITAQEARTTGSPLDDQQGTGTIINWIVW